MAVSQRFGPRAPGRIHVGVLVALLVLWKVLLLSIACASPGVGYDTSSRLLLPSASAASESLLTRVSHHVSSRLIRWDAVYYLRIAQRGYLFEQEWAFSWGFTRLVALLARASVPAGQVLSPLRVALTGIIVAHLSHLLSVILLFALTLSILPHANPQRVTCAFLAGVLHIVSPAGIFLSAPYSESLFSCLSFLGMLLYSKSFAGNDGKSSSTLKSLAILGSGVSWGLAASVRGNGVLTGIVLAYRCLTLVKSLPSISAFRTLTVTIASGILVALGNILPQWLAYHEYCSSTTPGACPVWCSRLPPSIFSWVQEHYWNVGFLRYWTLSNAPLFLLAIPVICLMSSTALVAIFEPALLLPHQVSGEKADSNSQMASAESESMQRYVCCMRSFALPQAVLALLTLTNFHVQIVNRLSSGYPIWYIVLAMAFTARNPTVTVLRKQPKAGVCGNIISHLHNPRVQLWVFNGMVLYALVQCGLYASFLPPA